MKKNINQFPSKSKIEMHRLLKSFIAVSLVGTSSFAHLGHSTAQAEELNKDDLKDSSFIEKNAGPLDPSLRHATIQDLHNMPNYVTSTFYDKFNQLSNEKQDKANENGETIFDKKNKSFIKVNAQDYLHIISSNGDNVFVHYVTSDGKRLSYTQKDLKNMQEKDDDNHSSHSSMMPWLIYPFLLNNNSYSSHANGMHSNMSSTTGKNAYNSRANSSGFKNSVKSTSNSISKSSSSSSTRGMGGSMSKGGGGGS